MVQWDGARGHGQHHGPVLQPGRKAAPAEEAEDPWMTDLPGKSLKIQEKAGFLPDLDIDWLYPEPTK